MIWPTILLRLGVFDDVDNDGITELVLSDRAGRVALASSMDHSLDAVIVSSRTILGSSLLVGGAGNCERRVAVVINVSPMTSPTRHL